MPESSTRKKRDFTPPPKKKDPVAVGPSRWMDPTMITMFLIGLA